MSNGTQHVPPLRIKPESSLRPSVVTFRHGRIWDTVGVSFRSQHWHWLRLRLRLRSEHGNGFRNRDTGFQFAVNITPEVVALSGCPPEKG
jgi:hypothetical protein